MAKAELLQFRHDRFSVVFLNHANTGGRLVAKARDTHGLASGGANQLPATAAARRRRCAGIYPPAPPPPAATLAPDACAAYTESLISVQPLRAASSAIGRTPAMRTSKI
ncbi:hypothetical protein EVAR_65325_1 [Eumeta japonica]|uniref:Uncharacterized protein n=1 Tax=Eumeta variegata TaxID=151549 RepID=A0A4C1YWT6_EUMVA|nr:hypothetical protein EVAR_65325_1 [Eumeta japonica]